ncbi:velvet factor-domain-containing protein [Mycena olivaceomarginata]|nr:velvet factor-domain-containing protein [Mycena olivaceomarginata]
MMPHKSGDHNQYLTDRLGKRLIGGPIYFTAGQFSGKIIHATLQEITVSEFREAQVDRRPLDPPPVVWLRLFEVFNIGTACETQLEMNYEWGDIDPSGLMCTVDLFPVPSPASVLPNAFEMPTAAPLRWMKILFSKSPDNATTKLVGTTFVQADSIPWKGRTCLLFTFADLAVKIEGFFILKYRFFDIFSTPGDDTDPPIQAECCSAPFRIYSPRFARDLAPRPNCPSNLAHYGVRLNILRDQAKSESADDERASCRDLT